MIGAKGIAINLICEANIVVMESNTLFVVVASSAKPSEEGACISISMPVYPFSANIPDQSPHVTSGALLAVCVFVEGKPRARTKTSGKGDSRVAAGDGCRQRYRVHVDAEEEEDWRVEGRERPKNEIASGLSGRRNAIAGGSERYMVYMSGKGFGRKVIE